MPPPRTRIGFVSDVHLHNHSKFAGRVSSGINRRGRSIFQAIDRLIEIAHTKRLDVLVIAGDLFDVSNPLPQLVAELLRRMEAFRGRWVIVEGNHDMKSPEIGDHALGPLRFGSSVQVVERPTTIDDPKTGEPLLYAVPFRPGPAIEWFPTELPKGIPLTIHLGVVDDETPEFLRNSDDALPVKHLVDLSRKFNIPAVFAGNWHNPNEWPASRAHIVQMGVFAPKSIAEAGHDFGHLAIYDSAKQAVEPIVNVPGPRFVRADSLDVLDSTVVDPAFDECDVFVEYHHVDASESLGAIYARLSSLVTSNRIADWRVIPAMASREEIDESVAAAIVASSSFEEAAEEYLSHLPSASEKGVPIEVIGRARTMIRSYMAGRSALEEQTDGNS